MGHNARAHCGPIQSVKRKAKYAAQFQRTAANKAKHKARAQALLEAKLLKYG